jgi:hypothetical protein
LIVETGDGIKGKAPLHLHSTHKIKQGLAIEQSGALSKGCLKIRLAI